MIDIIPNWHPVFVHFTVALLSISVILFVVTRFMGNKKLRAQWEVVAQWNLWLGAMITLVTVAMGVVAYNTVAHDTPSHEAMTEHRNLALVTTFLFVMLAILSALRARVGQGINVMILVGLVLACGLLFSTAWHGGEIVYRYGLGVMSLPKVDSHGHAAADHHAEEHSHGGATYGEATLATSPAVQNDSHMQKDDVDNCELPEKAAQSQVAPAFAPASDTPHDHLDGHAHGTDEVDKMAPTATVTTSSEVHHNDGHSDHQH